MKKHHFTLILSGVAELTAGLVDAVYEATKGDIEFSMTEGVAYLDFVRAAPTLDKAVRSAIADVEQANLGIRVVRVESETANTIAKINASLLGVAGGR